MIQWFPGHMNKARRELAAIMVDTDVVIEVIDARAVAATSNPLLEEMRYEGAKQGAPPRTVPVIKLINKEDLAQPSISKKWRSFFLQDTSVQVMIGQARDAGLVRPLMQRCRELGEARLAKAQKVRVLVVGVPNTGKSTLINTLRGKKIARTGNEAAVTRSIQKVDLQKSVTGVALFDSPGMLWPDLSKGDLKDENTGLILAILGSIRDSALDVQDIGLSAAKILSERCPEALLERYKIKDEPEGALEWLEAVGRRRGCLVSGGEVDHSKAAQILLTDLREGRLGRLSLERPPVVEDEGPYIG